MVELQLEEFLLVQEPTLCGHDFCTDRNADRIANVRQHMEILSYVLEANDDLLQKKLKL